MREDGSASGTYSREDSDFTSQGTRCAGWLYLPDGASRPPVVVMAHGFAAERTFGLPDFAERFLERGMACFLFDYRSFGGSDGEPRNLVSNSRHLRDWEAAVAHVRGLPGIDADRVALWGSSFSGGHVIVIASRDSGIAAIVSQVPFVDGLTTAYRTGFKHAMQATVVGAKDLFTMLSHREPYYVPVVSDPDTFGLMNSPDSLPGYMAIVPEDSDWENRCPARAVLELLVYRPVARARQVRCPALVIMADNDALIYPRSVERTASSMREVTLIHLDAGHFDVYVGDLFKEVVETEADFLARHLGVSR
ncbi:MAG: alpha/beta fold hydrolase [Actinomycetota bacterium]|nr:alpha/beta fold hydrolase [Actinomycetota bacterium]